MISPTGSASFVGLASVLLLFFFTCHGRITAADSGLAPRANGLWIVNMFLGDGRYFPPVFATTAGNSVTVITD